MFSVRFHPDAEQEFREAVLWYENQRTGLGSEFVLSIDESIERIRKSPEAYPEIYGHVRKIVVRRFPFAVFYDTTSLELRVIAVFHSRRDPQRWKSRK